MRITWYNYIVEPKEKHVFFRAIEAATATLAVGTVVVLSSVAGAKAYLAFEPSALEAQAISAAAATIAAQDTVPSFGSIPATENPDLFAAPVQSSIATGTNAAIQVSAQAPAASSTFAGISSTSTQSVSSLASSTGTAAESSLVSQLESAAAGPLVEPAVPSFNTSQDQGGQQNSQTALAPADSIPTPNIFVQSFDQMARYAYQIYDYFASRLGL